MYEKKPEDYFSFVTTFFYVNCSKTATISTKLYTGNIQTVNFL